MSIIVSAPANLIVATSDGIDVRFAGVDLDTDVMPSPTYRGGGKGIRISFEGVRGPETQERDVAFLRARAAWVDRTKAHGEEAAGDMPTMPGDLALSPVKAIVVDDMGTEYRLESGRVAGDGTEWSASWVYVPEPPVGAQRLQLQHAQ
ncbi:hypothetical protein [Georgenia ruanii]|uniref:hypothetical protein n=1 Tax=Georgenia ruanii TaxID=348442 RepID=UPI001264425F|nr:hypothetical protein [Georgenia ruanii]